MGKDWALVIVFVLLGRHEVELRATPPALPRAALELRYDGHALSRALARVPHYEITLSVDARAAWALSWLGLAPRVRVAAPQAEREPAALSSAASNAQNAQPEDTPPLSEPVTSSQTPPEAAPEVSVASTGAATLDIVQVTPDAASVFAGTAPPGADVTVLDGGAVVGTARAGPDGNWSLATENKITGERSDITVTLTPPHAAPVAPESTVAALPAETATAPAPDTGPEKTSPAEELVKDLERKVEAARSESESRSGQAPSAPSESPASPAPSPASQESERLAAASGTGATAPASSESASQGTIPVPIQFVYREAALTPEGRRAAELLLEYLKLKSLKSITLSGHADERGGNRYNLELSRDRLAVIRRLLRDGGYDGRIKLLPRGESEPYQGVDRARLKMDDLMQFDRRVELRTSF